MSETMKAVNAEHPIMRDWSFYKTTENYKASFAWAQKPEHRDGSMWAAYAKGWADAVAAAASLHEVIDPASDAERRQNTPGAGAMGAVISYRDNIRKLNP